MKGPQLETPAHFENVSQRSKTKMESVIFEKCFNLIQLEKALFILKRNEILLLTNVTLAAPHPGSREDNPQ